MEARPVAIVGGMRIPFVRSFTAYSGDSNKDLLTQAFRGLVETFRLEGEVLDEVAAGAVMKFPGDWNLTRECVQGCGLDRRTPAYDVQRACGTSLESLLQVAHKIALGQAEVAIAGGVDTNSDLPVLFPKSFTKKMLAARGGRSPLEKIKPLLSMRLGDITPVFPGVTEFRTGLSMGQHCEKMAQEWEIPREDQDQLAHESHQKAYAAYGRGFYRDLITSHRGLHQDALLRPDTSVKKLAGLQPAFDKKSGRGSLTAGNSTALTDGAASVLLCSEDYAKKRGWEVLAYFQMAQQAAVDYVDGEGLLMAPTLAVSRLLQRAQKKLQDFDLYEIHEAFAAQVLCNLKAWESEKYCKTRLGLDRALGPIDREKMNVQGGSIALGHPFGATGARIVAGLAKSLRENQAKSGLISICTAGGMGLAAILERA